MRDKHSTQKLLVTITLVVVLLIGSATAVVAWRTHNEGAKDAKAAQSNTSHSQQRTTNLSYTGQNGKNALELLKQHASVITKNSSYGEYVDSIDGVAGGTGGKYWTFYVNGQQASVGAGAYATHNTDKIEWKLQ
jgi:hypothetical protein